jgi:uncharacterized protein
MEYVIIPLTAFGAALLTFFSGFGLGTILTPVFALFFRIDLAIALTGVVHFVNNLFKLALIGRKADRGLLLRFGVPAVIAAFLGAYVLLQLSDLSPWYQYQLGGKTFEITPVKLIIAVLLGFFAILDFLPRMERLQIKSQHMPFGGALSGFFGGLSGHQGALRSAFLIKAGLSKEGFIATGTIIATFIDLTRLGVYATRFTQAGLQAHWPLVLAAILAAISGAYLGLRLLKKITLQTVQRTVAVLLVLISLALGAGLI